MVLNCEERKYVIKYVYSTLYMEETLLDTNLILLGGLDGRAQGDER